MRLKITLLIMALISSAIPAMGNGDVRYYVDMPASSFVDPQGGAISKVGILDYFCVAAPANPPSGQVRVYCDSGTGNITCLTSAGTNACPTGGGGGGGAFSTITSGTNTGQALIVGAASSLSASGGGTITATAAPYSGITSFPVACTTSPHLFATQIGPTNQGCTQVNFTDLAGSIALGQTPLTTVGDILSVNAVPSLVRVPGGITGSILFSTNGSPGSFVPPGITGRTVSGTTDTILCDTGTATRDRAASVRYTSGSAIAVTLPQAGSAGCGNNFVVKLFVTGAGNATVTPTTSTINGNANVVIPSGGGWCTISSPDNTNYLATCASPAGGGTVTSIATTSPIGGGTITTSGTITCTTCITGSSMTSGQLATGNTGQAITVGNLSGDVTTSGSTATTIAANAVTAAKSAVVLTRRTCMIIVGADNGTALANADLGPQGRQCFVSEAATIVEVTVAADAGTPNVIPAKNHAGVLSNSVSSALATAGSGGIACSNTGGTTGLDGATTCSATLQNTSLAAGDWIDLVSGTAGGTAKRMSISVTYTVN